MSDGPPPPQDQSPPGWDLLSTPPPPSSDLVAYLQANRDRYTREALEGRLAAAGHPPEAIAAAWAAALLEDSATGHRDRREQTAWIIAAAYAATWLAVTFLVMAPNDAMYGAQPILAGILAVALLIPGLIAVRVALSAGWLRRAGVGRVVAFAFVPMLILFALAGTCVSYVRAV